MSSQIVENVLHEARKHKAKEVAEVHLVIGKLTFLGLEQVRFSYEVLTGDGVLEKRDFQAGEAKDLHVLIGAGLIISDIPDLLMPGGDRDRSTVLDEYVVDAIYPDSQIEWSVAGADEVQVQIDQERRVVLQAPEDWSGTERLSFTARSPDGLEGTDDMVVTVIGRSRTGINDAGLREVVVDDFTDYSALTDVLGNQDVALYCLGVYTGAVPDDLFRQITVDYTLAFARALQRASPQAGYCFLSGQGADQTGKSHMAFARYKGEAEKTLLEIGFPRVHIFRPGYIYPVTPRKEPNLVYTITRFLYPLLRRLYPNIGISTEGLAAAMVHAGLYGTGENENPVLENKDIRFLDQQRTA